MSRRHAPGSSAAHSDDRIVAASIAQAAKFFEQSDQRQSFPRRVLSGEEDNFANRTEASKETEAGQISKEAHHNLDRARSAIDNALDLLRLVVGDDGDGSEQSTEAPWPLVNFSSSRR